MLQNGSRTSLSLPRLLRRPPGQDLSNSGKRGNTDSKEENKGKRQEKKSNEMRSMKERSSKDYLVRDSFKQLH